MLQAGNCWVKDPGGYFCIPLMLIRAPRKRITSWNDIESDAQWWSVDRPINTYTQCFCTPPIKNSTTLSKECERCIRNNIEMNIILFHGSALPTELTAPYPLVIKPHNLCIILHCIMKYNTFDTVYPSKYETPSITRNGETILNSFWQVVKTTEPKAPFESSSSCPHSPDNHLPGHSGTLLQS